MSFPIFDFIYLASFVWGVVAFFRSTYHAHKKQWKSAHYFILVAIFFALVMLIDLS